MAIRKKCQSLPNIRILSTSNYSTLYFALYRGISGFQEALKELFKRSKRSLICQELKRSAEKKRHKGKELRANYFAGIFKAKGGLALNILRRFFEAVK